MEARPTGGGAFSPLSVSGCVYWADASQQTGYVDNDLVNSVTDFSGGGHTGTAAGSARPTYKTGIMNSLPVFRFDGAANTITIPRAAALEPNTVSIFATFRATTVGAFCYLMSKSRILNTDTSYGIQSDGSDRLRSVVTVATTGTVPGSSVTFIDAFDGVPRLWCATSNALALTEYLDGSSSFAGSPVTAVGNLDYTTRDLYLGSIDGANLFAAYDLGELLIYNNVVSAQNRWNIAAYMAGKWGVS